ncbi:MAG: hypothetical protein KKF52_00895 [Nanoarchaeota archaeon]|nr:hypothetical protein [Nanoarchaeota archaeon]MBU4241765.1 hypothetical protein [Nanoarchaeota archaeon]MBU4351748.1 hypothetical protein [Nanoarchaeota archaeon]
MVGNIDDRQYFKNPIFDRDLEFILKILEKCGAKDIKSILVLSEDTNQIVYPPQYIITFQGTLDREKYYSYFYC